LPLRRFPERIVLAGQRRIGLCFTKPCFTGFAVFSAHFLMGVSRRVNGFSGVHALKKIPETRYFSLGNLKNRSSSVARFSLVQEHELFSKNNIFTLVRVI
jgi:hypothetical protein